MSGKADGLAHLDHRLDRDTPRPLGAIAQHPRNPRRIGGKLRPPGTERRQMFVEAGGEDLFALDAPDPRAPAFAIHVDADRRSPDEIVEEILDRAGVAR